MHRWLALALVLCAMLVGSCGRRADVPPVVLADDGKAETQSEDSGLVVTFADKVATVGDAWWYFRRIEDKDYGAVCYVYRGDSSAMVCFLTDTSRLRYPPITDTRQGE